MSDNFFHLDQLVRALEELAEKPPDDALLALERIKKKLPPARDEIKHLLNEIEHGQKGKKHTG